ncbi:hypothetical protein D7V86_17580 [bacterium D16-51]|nr:hypothetical protein D7V96_17705 [bacterium D16-59]RKI57461.1 hypothetical protein D7V86_17580 [bacterium D16-51]
MHQIKKLYNILSSALRKIENCVSERDFERLRNLDEQYEQSIVEELKVKFPDMFDKGTCNVSEISERHLERSSLVKDLEVYLNISSNKEELIFLVKYMDSFLEDTYYRYIPVDQEQYLFKCLNDNFQECQICLIPRIVCGWEHNNRDAYTSYSIFYYLRNFYYISGTDARDYEVQHILMSKSLFREAVRRGKLHVMVSPVTNEEVVETTEPYVRDNVRFVSIIPMKHDTEMRIQNICKDALKKAASEEADIMLFPEMMATDNIVDYLGNELDIREDMLNNEFPRLVICPTVWKQQHNYCRILDDMGDTVCEQQKHYGVDLKQCSAKEDIVSNRKIVILHCYGVGRIAVAICKDFLITNYLRLLIEKLKVNLLLVPSFTGKDYQFEVLLPKYGEQDLNVIWLNACSAKSLNGIEEVMPSLTMAYLPGKKGILEEKHEAADLCEKQCNCGKACIYTYHILLDGEVVV